jgi:iron complex transport system permease protein
VTALRIAGDRVALRVQRRPLIVAALLAAACAALGVAGMALGDFPLSVGEVLRTLAGQGAPGSDFIVTTLRLPRVLTAILVGAAFGVSGAIFQSIARNPLGSPDVIGFTTGSATGALLVIIAVGAGSAQLAAGAVAGGLVAAVAVYLLAYRGGVQGYRLVLVGIGVSAMLLSVNAYLITRASRQDAYVAAHWLVGSLNGRGWEHVYPVAAALAVLLPVALLLSRRLAMLELGDDAAKALGVPVERTRLAMVLLAVALVAVGTASTGPVAFVALAAPQIARRLSNAAVPGLAGAALTGALIMLASDLAAQHLLGVALPAGVATGIVGGLYLAWLLGFPKSFRVP